MVLFLHMTSRVDGDPYPTLLQEKGFRGFPSLAFMDADGDVLATQGERSVGGFRKTLTALESYLDLKAKSEAGDESVANALFIAELQLGKVSFADAQARLGGLEGLSVEQRETIDAEMINLEVDDQLTQIQSGRATQEAVQKSFAEMAKEDRIPEGAAAGMFWQMVLFHADSGEDAKLFERSLEVLRGLFGKDPNNARVFENWDNRLKELKGGD